MSLKHIRRHVEPDCVISDITVLLYGSSQTHLGTEVPSGGGHIIEGDFYPEEN